MEGLYVSDGSWCKNGDILLNEALLYYKNHFAPSRHHSTVPLNLNSQVMLCEVGQAKLLNPVSKYEVYCALKSMKPFKAPSRMGSNLFLQNLLGYY